MRLRLSACLTVGCLGRLPWLSWPVPAGTCAAVHNPHLPRYIHWPHNRSVGKFCSVGDNTKQSPDAPKKTARKISKGRGREVKQRGMCHFCFRLFLSSFLVLGVGPYCQVMRGYSALHRHYDRYLLYLPSRSWRCQIYLRVFEKIASRPSCTDDADKLVYAICSVVCQISFRPCNPPRCC